VTVCASGDKPGVLRSRPERPSPTSTVGYLDLQLRVDSPTQPEIVDTSCAITVQYGKREYALTLPIRVAFVGKCRVEPDPMVFTAARGADLVGIERHARVNVEPGAWVGAVRLKECPRWLACRLKQVSRGEYDVCARVCTAPPELCGKAKIVLGLGTGKPSDAVVDLLTFALSN
jgi:hypothetical protein